MANFSSAFGFKVYLVPCLSTAVNVSTVTGGVGETGFIALGAADANVVATDAVISEGATAAEILVGGADVVAGAATPIELLGLTDASLSTDTASEEVVTYSEIYGMSWDGVTTGMDVATASVPVYDTTDKTRYKFLGAVPGLHVSLVAHRGRSAPLCLCGKSLWHSAKSWQV